MLSGYRKYFLEIRGWSAAAIAIAEAIGCDERTIRRIVEDYERVAEVPDQIIKWLELRGIDPSARKNASMLSKLLTIPQGPIDSTSNASMLSTIRTSRPSGMAVTDQTGDVPVPLSREEKRQSAMRSKIRIALMNVPPDRRISEFVAALEEVYFECGHVEPITVTMTPRRLPSASNAGVRQMMVA